MSDYGSTPPPPPPPGEGQGSGQYQGMGGMPSYESAPTAAPVERPASIAQAVKLMYVGAALSVLNALSTLLFKDEIRDAVEKASAKSTSPMTDSGIDAAVNLAVGSSIFFGLVGAALWLWMASANGKGRKWARIVATVFFALSVLSTLGSLVQHPPVLSLVVGIITVVLGAYILYLLYRPESSQYYEAQSAPRI